MLSNIDALNNNLYLLTRIDKSGGSHYLSEAAHAWLRNKDNKQALELLANGFTKEPEGV